VAVKEEEGEGKEAKLKDSEAEMSQTLKPDRRPCLNNMERRT